MSSRFRALLLFLLPAFAFAASPFDGRWRLDPARSTALDGWNLWDLVVHVEGDHVALRHDMQWRTTKFTATNTVDTTQPVVAKDFFRVEQRHMALYPAKGGDTNVRAQWIDNGRTLRVEAETPIEASQGRAAMRLYTEYRLLEGGQSLLVIELHSTRPTPLVYRFTRANETK